MANLTISSAFESGSIEVVDASDPADIQLKLVPEPHSELEDATFMQWFHFSVYAYSTQICISGWTVYLFFSDTTGCHAPRWPTSRACR